MGDSSGDIVAIPPGWLGDAVMALPALRALESLGALTLLAHPRVAPLYRLTHDPARVVPFPSPLFSPRAAALHRNATNGRPGLAVVFPRSFSSAWRARLAGARERIGFASRGRSWLLTRAIRPAWAERSRHLTHEFELLVGEAGARPPTTVPRIDLADASKERAERLLERAGLAPSQAIVAICPGAAYGPAKRWSADRFADVASRLAREGMRVVLLGGSDDRAVADEVTRLASGSPLDLVGETDLELLCGVLARARVALVNDSGPMHVAAALGTAVVAVFGSTNPEWTRPLGERHAVLRYPVPCSPCYRRHCPIDRICFEGVSVESVWTAVAERLAG